MKTILKLWRGELSHEALSDSSIRERIRDKPLEEKVIKEAAEFNKSLSEEQRKLFLSYWLVESDEWSVEVNEAFINGFRTGALLMKDVLE